MSVTELKERHSAATDTVNNLRHRLKQKRLSLLDTDGNNLFFFNCFAIIIDYFRQHSGNNWSQILLIELVVCYYFSYDVIFVVFLLSFVGVSNFICESVDYPTQQTFCCGLVLGYQSREVWSFCFKFSLVSFLFVFLLYHYKHVLCLV